MALHAYVDESFEGAYLMALVAVDGGDVAATRSKTRRLRARGASRFHMSSESDQRRDRALALIRELPVTAVVVEVRGDTPAHQRRVRAIESIVSECVRLGASRLLFELDISVVRRDRSTVARALRSTDDASALTYGFVGGAAEPLLWLPDAVAWAWARGGHWRGKLPEGLRRIRA